MRRLSMMMFVLCLFMSNGYVICAEKLPKQLETIEVSESCYKKQQQISKDFASLGYLFKGVFNNMGKQGDPEHKPSSILLYLRDKSSIDEDTPLEYMPATGYLHTFITDQQYNELDVLFADKYKETHDVALTWNWFDDHFRENVLRKSIDSYCKEMMYRDAARITLEKQGISFTDDGRTLVMDGNRMSDTPEGMAAVRDALGVLYK